MASGRLMSKAEYARHRDVSRAMVTHWSKAGRIKLIDDQVDAFESDAMLARSLDPARGGKGGKSARAGVVAPPQGPAPAQRIAPPADEPDDLSFDASSSYTRVRTVTEQYRAKQAEITYRKAVGELVERARMELAIANICGALRKSLQRLPDVLAARLAAEPDPRKVRAMLVEHTDQMLNDLSDALTALPEQLTATSQ